MTKKELTILGMLREDIQELKTEVKKDIFDLHKRVTDHMNGSCKTQDQLDKHEKNHKWNITTVISIVMCLVSVVTLIIVFIKIQ